MQLYVTPTSPFARLALIVRAEKSVEDRVELVWTRTRIPDDPMLAFNPSGRIPFLRLPNGEGFEDTDIIVEYLDRLRRPLIFGAPGAEDYWPYRRLQATARSMLDGVSVWGREIVRPEADQSPTIIEHEKRRAGRLADYFEARVADAPLTGEINLVQLLLFCALEVERRVADYDWRTGRPGLVDWHTGMADRPSVKRARDEMKNSVPGGSANPS